MMGNDVISPDQNTPSVNTTFGIKEQQIPHLRSSTNSQIMYHLMTLLSLKEGIKQWKQADIDAVQKEMQQMHDLNVFEPVD